MSLKCISKNVYTYEFTYKIMPGIHFSNPNDFNPSQNNEALIISPGPFDEDDLQEIRGIADRFHIVAPNLFHHAFFTKASDLSSSTLYAPSQLKEKLKPAR